MMLQIRNLTGGYSKDHDILQGINLDVAKGASVSIIGLNGSGKSSLAKAVMNILPCRGGQILFDGIDVTKKTTRELSESGVALFMQGGRVYDELSVWDNLIISARDKNEIKEILEYFPAFRFPKSRLSKMKADTLSGGLRHQLALMSCMLRKPSLLILDEPTAGLSPAAVDTIYQILDIFREKNNLTTLLIEQNVSRAVDFCTSIVMLRNGKIVFSSENPPVSSSASPLRNGEVMSCSNDKSFIIKEIETIMFNADS